jgi:hypothetical protein
MPLALWGVLIAPGSHVRMARANMVAWRSSFVTAFAVCYVIAVHLTQGLGVRRRRPVGPYPFKGATMKYIAKILALTAVAFAVLAPALAEAHSHQVCHYDHHHHRVCHWVK